MTMLKKWDWATGEYRPYEVPDDWEVSCFETEMRKVVNCAQCGRAMHYGDCFTSREVHSDGGFGYCVCDDCYWKEWAREREARR